MILTPQCKYLQNFFQNLMYRNFCLKFHVKISVSAKNSLKSIGAYDLNFFFSRTKFILFFLREDNVNQNFLKIKKKNLKSPDDNPSVSPPSPLWIKCPVYLSALTHFVFLKILWRDIDGRNLWFSPLPKMARLYSNLNSETESVIKKYDSFTFYDFGNEVSAQTVSNKFNIHINGWTILVISKGVRFWWGISLTLSRRFPYLWTRVSFSSRRSRQFRNIFLGRIFPRKRVSVSFLRFKLLLDFKLYRGSHNSERYQIM